MSGDVSNTHISRVSYPPGNISRGSSSNSLSQGAADEQHSNDEQRRKQAEARRPMMMRRMLVWDMNEKKTLEQAFEQQLAKRQFVSGDVSNTHILSRERTR